jgi:hypothetical protein
MTSVKNQGGCGSCVAFAAVGAFEGQLKIQAYNPTWDIDLSEQHLFSCGGGSCSGGWYISSALNYLQQYGTPDEACSPYRAQSGSSACSNSCPDWQSRVFKISSWNWINTNPSSIEAALMNGPLVAGFTVYADFYNGYRSGVYHWDHVSQAVGGHAIVIVGYDQPGQYWIVKNSWGTNWGEAGYFRIGFGEAGIESSVASITTPLTVTKTVTATQSSTSYSYGTTTATVTSYTSTLTSMSTIIVPTTVTLAPLASTVQTTQVQTSTGTTTVTGYTTMIVTSYTGTQTGTSTTVVYTTVTKSGAGGAAPSPLAFLGFLSLLAVTVGHGVTASNGWKVARSRLGRRCSSN